MKFSLLAFILLGSFQVFASENSNKCIAQDVAQRTLTENAAKVAEAYKSYSKLDPKYISEVNENYIRELKVWFDSAENQYRAGYLGSYEDTAGDCSEFIVISCDGRISFDYACHDDD